MIFPKNYKSKQFSKIIPVAALAAADPVAATAAAFLQQFFPPTLLEGARPFYWLVKNPGPLSPLPQC